MKIVIDATPFYHGSAGISHYTSGLIEGLSTIDRQNTYILYGGRQGLLNAIHKKKMIPLPTAENFRIVVSRAPSRFSFALNLLPVEIYLGEKADIYHGTSFLLPRTLRRTKKVVTIHDLSFEINIKWYPENIYSRAWRDSVRESAFEADRIIAPSQSTRTDIMAIYGIPGEKIAVIQEAPLKIFYASDISENFILEVKKKYHLPRNFVLSVGRIEKRKNFVILPEVLSKLKKQLVNPPQLVIAGNDGYGADEFYREVERCGVEKDVIIYKNLPTEVLPVLYKEALVFIYPTLYEGFGLPILEAMTCGCPVVMTNSSSLPEVGGDAAIIVDSGNAVEEISDAVARILSDENLRNDYIKRGKAHARKFRWESTAAQTLELYKSIASG